MTWHYDYACTLCAGACIGALMAAEHLPHLAQAGLALAGLALVAVTWPGRR